MATAYGLFLGCVAPNRYPGIESSTREVMKVLGVSIKDLEGASCCPAPGVTRSFNQIAWLAIGARNIAIAESMGVDIITICNGCFGSLAEVDHKLKEDEKLKAAVNKVLSKVGLSYKGTSKVRHFAEFLYRDIGLEKIADKVVRPVDLKVAVHYGCHFLKPSKLKHIDDPETPHILDDLVEVTGAKSIDYVDKNLCCGSGGGVRARNPDLALKMTLSKLREINKTEAQAIIDICPFCHLQYDRGQVDVKAKFNEVYTYPVIHLSQLYGVAFGIDLKKLGLDKQEIPALHIFNGQKPK